MKQFILKATLLLLCFFCICIGLELYLLTISNEYSYKKNYVEQQGEKIKTLVLGHSHAGDGIMPHYLGDSVFNMATQGRNTYYDAIISKRYVPKLKNLECVIWPLGYNFQYSSYKYPLPRKSKEPDLSASYRCMFAKYMDISYEDEFRYRYWSELINSRLDYGKRLFIRDFEATHHCDSTGFEPITVAEKSPTWREDKLPKEMEYNHPNATKAFAHTLSYMKQIAQVCKEADVRLIVITFPCYRSFVELTTPRGMKEMQACVDSMKRVYPAMEYYNYMSDPRFEEDDFCNSSHLTDVGARKFSSILREEVMQHR